MRTYTVTSKVTAEEREVTINISCENGEWVANLYTCIEKYANKCKSKVGNRLMKQDTLTVRLLELHLLLLLKPLVLETLTRLKGSYQKNINKSF